MTLRTKGEQKAYLDGFKMCAKCIEKYLTYEGKQKLDCLLMAVRNAVEIEDIEPQESEDKHTESHACDCISREAAIQAVTHFDDTLKRLYELPSVEPERKTGKWKYVQYDGNQKIGNWHCSECRLIVNFGFEGAPYYHYCPGCGVKMEVDG